MTSGERARRRLQGDEGVRSSSSAHVAQFFREAEITDDLRQPGVVPIYPKVVDGSGLPAYAMEFIDGETLHDAVQKLSLKHAQQAMRGAGSTSCSIPRRLPGRRRPRHGKRLRSRGLNLKNFMLVESAIRSASSTWGSALQDRHRR